ncbi:hypothetical protein [Bacteroides sp. 224]|uniref:hypothetical protein n=1 Tax=Bacteroides sp. 224 TaxID=2302936 RepID=UPI0013D1CF52|nr:hypothetical protein [Bacteroides sp. 224]NDV66647.1 hypothetical protein [Bacteroides sp. 224]
MTIKDFENRASFQGGYDRVFGEWKIIDIHEIPDKMSEHHEVDFYCSNGKQVYLLRLRNRGVEKYEIVGENPSCLIAELPIRGIDDRFLEVVLSKFGLGMGG